MKPRSDFEVIFPADVLVNCTDPQPGGGPHRSRLSGDQRRRL
ncbi:MAG: hypothetical protein R2806_03015 [Saprospiraceae bacterium]